MNDYYDMLRGVERIDRLRRYVHHLPRLSTLRQETLPAREQQSTPIQVAIATTGLLFKISRLVFSWFAARWCCSSPCCMVEDR